jgi:precorrin-6B methylase 2
MGDKKQVEIEVPFEPTPPQVVDQMLKLAGVNEADTLYDLGCGDGRIVVMAAQKYKAHGFGVDLDSQRIEECKENAQSAGVTDRVQFKMGDIMQQDLRPATAVTLYLLNEVNLMLRPKLYRELKPGTRIVSHAFHMADWKADKTEHPPKARDNVIYLWIMPAPVGGVWQWTTKTAKGEETCRLDLRQEFQVVLGSLTVAGSKKGRISGASLSGRALQFSATMPDGQRQAKVLFKGVVDGDTIKGTQQGPGGSRAGAQEWVAKRDPVNLAGSWRIKVQDSPEPLDGVLRLDEKDGALKATYIADKDKNETALPGFIAQGASINFEIPIKQGDEDRGPVFSGALGGDRGDGRVTQEGSKDKLVWVAQREK